MHAPEPEQKHFESPFQYGIASGTEQIELPRWRGQASQKQDAGHSSVTRINTSSTVESEPPSYSLCTTTSTISTTLATRPVARRLVFTHPICWSDLTVSLATRTSGNSAALEPTTPLYHAATHELNFTVPDIELYRCSATNMKAQLLGAAHFRFSRHARMGFGGDWGKLNGKDTHDGDVEWEECRNLSPWCWHARYQFAVPCEFPEGNENTIHRHARKTGRRRFLLERTRAEEDGVQGWLGWASFRNYRLIDVDTGDVVGIFLSDDLRSLSRSGELRLFEKLCEKSEVGVVLALAVVIEKHVRRRRRGGKCGTGGGGTDGG
jgi:hypothetical protein